MGNIQLQLDTRLLLISALGNRRVSRSKPGSVPDLSFLNSIGVGLSMRMTRSLKFRIGLWGFSILHLLIGSGWWGKSDSVWPIAHSGF